MPEGGGKMRDLGDAMNGGIYWCPECNVPLLQTYCGKCGSEGRYCANDLKPVFGKEKKMFENFLSLELPDNLFRNRNRIILDGSALFRFKIDFHRFRLSSIEPPEVIESRLNNHVPEGKGKSLKKLRRSNEKALKEKEKNSIRFIKETSKKYQDLFKTISFAGGKDSSVVAILAKKALGDIPLFFSDTTLEYSETYKFVEDFAKKYHFELIKDENGKFYRSPQNFFELCDELGPPSIRYRWCCTVFKAQPVNEFYKAINGDVLTFDGTRKNESRTRKNYEEISSVKKICRQIAAYPILSWREADVWFYILFNKIAYNPLYELGYTRVGCFPCPNASPSNCFFRKLTHPELWGEFEKVLERYAEKYGKDRNWIDGNYWRLRLPKKDRVTVVSPYNPCASDHSLVYDFKFPIDRHLLEHFKPFGDVVMGEIAQSEYFRLKSRNPFKMSGIVGGSRLTVAFDPQSFPKAKKLFEKQLTRALNCVGCGGCIGICPFGAISILSNHFTIDSNKCAHCKKCLQGTCIAMNFKTERKIIKK